MIFALSLLAGLTTNSAAVVQTRVDELVMRCDASKVVQLVAQDESRVAMTLLLPAGDVTAAQNQQFTCVLEGMKAMPDLSFGFLGNEEAPTGN